MTLALTYLKKKNTENTESKVSFKHYYVNDILKILTYLEAICQAED